MSSRYGYIYYVYINVTFNLETFGVSVLEAQFLRHSLDLGVLLNIFV